jgi:UDP-N-acetylglucosamine 2-epimerase (non-hydrolysing)
VGNVMIDTLLRNRSRAAERDVLARLEVREHEYALCTLHRPSNVDTLGAAANTFRAVQVLAEQLTVVLPLHPRTRSRWDEFGYLSELRSHPRVILTEPQGYLDFLALMDHARVVMTDSGGVQEETTALGVPCLTFRENTERPITVTHGTNQLVGRDPRRLAVALDHVLSGPLRLERVPELWDGQAAHRILEVLQPRQMRLPLAA